LLAAVNNKLVFEIELVYDLSCQPIIYMRRHACWSKMAFKQFSIDLMLVLT